MIAAPFLGVRNMYTRTPCAATLVSSVLCVTMLFSAANLGSQRRCRIQLPGSPFCRILNRCSQFLCRPPQQPIFKFYGYSKVFLKSGAQYRGTCEPLPFCMWFCPLQRASSSRGSGAIALRTHSIYVLLCLCCCTGNSMSGT